MKRAKIDLEAFLEEISQDIPNWKEIKGEGLHLDYAVLLGKSMADELMLQLQETIEYNEGELAKVKVFGKWHEIPRQQAAYGNDGTQYHFSGITLPAKPWTPVLGAVRRMVSKVAGVDYNFVLVNRYRNGNDHIGEHKDSEPELDKNAPIASLSLGQCRQFVLKHGDSRRKDGKRRVIQPVKIDLQHGSILLMQPPTNHFWYHSVPPRKNAPGVRINLTFRKINIQ